MFPLNVVTDFYESVVAPVVLPFVPEQDDPAERARPLDILPVEVGDKVAAGVEKFFVHHGPILAHSGGKSGMMCFLPQDGRMRQ